MKIFLSYAREDSKQIEAVRDELEAEGHDVFFDKDDLPVGGRFHKQIRDNIRSSDLFIAFLSPFAVDEHSYTLSEIEIARRTWPNPEGRVLAFVLPPYKMAEIKGIPSYLGNLITISEVGNANLEAIVAAVVEDEAKKHVGERMRLSYESGYQKGRRFGDNVVNYVVGLFKK